MAAEPVSGLRVVSEQTRERETFKYDPSLLSTIRYNDSGVPIPSAELVTSPDAVLTSFCQLGCVRLSTARSLISLFDESYQYVVAEGTPTLSLVPSQRHEDRRGEELWLCGTAIPRVHGACEHSLLAADNPDTFPGDGADSRKEEEQAARRLPLSLVSDLTVDPRFRDKPFCRPGRPARFFAAVPIRTHRGINIGVYCVMDTKPRDLSQWTDDHTELLGSISRTVMDYLEARRASQVHGRSDRMNRGLGSFVEGKESLVRWRRHGGGVDWRRDASGRDGEVSRSAKTGAAADKESALPEEKTLREMVSVLPERPLAEEPNPFNVDPVQLASDASTLKDTSTDRDATDATSITAASNKLDATEDEISPPLPLPPKPPPPLPKVDSIHDVFTRAATIIRQAIEAEGFLYLDASVGPSTSLAALRPTSMDSDDTASTAPSISSEAAVTAGDTTATDNGLTGDEAPGRQPCRVLGFSLSAASRAEGAKGSVHNAVPQRFMARLLRRYPRGKIFNFGEDGTLQSSDSSGEEGSSPSSGPAAGREYDDAAGTVAGTDGSADDGPGRNKTRKSGLHRRRRRHWSRRGDEGSAIQDIFPGARSVAFVPVWDAKKERWFAGGFAYTYTTTRIFTIEGELSYLRAFGMLTMEESFRLETQLADKAKADVLNSLSHELRSPLHGIVLGVELLNDTELSLFQENIAHTIETCSRTLLDTVDHLLDFSKINNYMAMARSRRRRGHRPESEVGARGLRKGAAGTIEAGLKSLFSDVRLDVLVEEVMESVFAGFNFQHMSVAQFAGQPGRAKNAAIQDGATAKHPDASGTRRLDSMRAMEEFWPARGDNGSYQLDFARVAIFLDVEPPETTTTPSSPSPWVFHTQAGAIRRIVMNLFGNALKYTSRGVIVVSLRQQPAKASRSGSHRGKLRMVQVRVADTGKGISEDYLKHELFRPFSQEDPLAPGAGLGLSLVKQITAQLRGRIEVESELGRGTCVCVSIPLLPKGRAGGGSDAAASAAKGTTAAAPRRDEEEEEDVELAVEVALLEGKTVAVAGFETADGKSRRDGSESQDDDGDLLKVDGHVVVEKMCRGFRMETIGLNLGRSRPATVADVILCTDDVLGRLGSDGGRDALGVAAPMVVVCANALQCHRRLTARESLLAGVVEFISQPTGPRKLAKAMSTALRKWRDLPIQPLKLDIPFAGATATVLSPPAMTPTSAAQMDSTAPLDGLSKTVATRSNTFGVPMSKNSGPVVSEVSVPGASSSASSVSGHTHTPNPTTTATSTNPADQPIFLLVDDNLINLKILATYMKKINKPYTTALNGREAVDAFCRADARFRCVFMDISMPVMDGFEATRKIRAFEKSNRAGEPPAAVFALSGLASANAQREAFESGIDLFLTKPVKLKELGSILEARGLL